MRVVGTAIRPRTDTRATVKWETGVKGTGPDHDLHGRVPRGLAGGAEWPPRRCTFAQQGPPGRPCLWAVARLCACLWEVPRRTLRAVPKASLMATTLPVTLTPPPPLQPEDMTFRTMFGSEALSRCFEYVVEVTSPRSDLDPEAILGAPTTVVLTRPDGVDRYFNGLVARFDYLGTAEDYGPSRYRLVLRPWLWLLTRTTDCRIFQNQSVVDILKTVFADFEFAHVDTTGLWSSEYAQREYTVQYRETDFHFVSRLMEEEGITYYFRHESGKHTLTLVDDASAYDMPEQTDDGFSLPYRGLDAHRDALMEYVSEWSSEYQVEPDSYAHTGFDFTKPRASLLAQQSASPGHTVAGLEVFDFPGPHLTLDAGNRLAGLRLEARQQDKAQARGWTNARALTVGCLFTLEEHPRDAENGTYLVTSATYQLRGQDAESGGASGSIMSTVFLAIEQGLPLRPALATYKPRAAGPQTAIVVGPSGQEIWTDQYGRVKVQFHWDRRGKSDENSSCFVRVSQSWAGTNFGVIHIPRIGQEVVVDFLEGDPDQPIITGRVYNALNPPPYSLPSNQTQSGIKTRSSKGGNSTSYNEIRFEDLKGSEELHIQAERDETIVVKANRTLNVGANETVTVGGTRTTTVAKKDTVTLQDEHEITVTKKVTQTYQDDQQLQLTGNQAIEIGKDKEEHVAQTYTLRTDTKFQLKQGSTTLTFESNKVTLDAASEVTVTRGPATLSIDDSGQMTLSTPTGITLQCGPNAIALSPSGIQVSGLLVIVKADPSTLELGPASAKLSGVMTKVEATAVCSIQGTAMLNLNSG